MGNYGVFPKTKEELEQFILDQETKPHDYNSIAEALTEITLATFNYYACKHGMTGYQSSWSALRFLGRSRGIEAPFMIVDSSKLLYPQYNLIEDVEKFLEESKPELAKQAQDNLDNEVNNYTSSKVIERWSEIAQYNK